MILENLKVYLWFGIEWEVAQQQLRQVGMNRLALACVTVVVLVDVVLGDVVVMKIYLNGAELCYVVVNETMFVVAGADDDNEHKPAVSWLENDREILWLANIFQFCDHQL